ncbi:MAG: hypothetical protein M3246_03385 [Actinomycetota bacterium]|nr:hypothetical protein [Actinomycetota bacterium]
MDLDEIKIPVPMRDARRIYAALGSLKRLAANECNDEFVETLDGLMGRLKDYHDTVVAGWGAGQDELIEGSEEDRRGPPGQDPQHDALPQDRAELLNRLYGAQTEGQIDDTVAAADRWLMERAHDEDVHLAREQAIRRRAGAPPL